MAGYFGTLLAARRAPAGFPALPLATVHHGCPPYHHTKVSRACVSVHLSALIHPAIRYYIISLRRLSYIFCFWVLAEILWTIISDLSRMGGEISKWPRLRLTLALIVCLGRQRG